MRSSTLARRVAALTLTKKAFDVALLDLRKLASVTDYFVICSADSENQIRAIVAAVEEGLEKQGVAAWNKELGSPNWVIMDFVDVVLHIFSKHARAYYNLEKLWGDAEIARIDDQRAATTRRGRPARASRRAPVKRKVAS